MTNTRQKGAFRIIVMDDEPLVLSSVSMLLESLGHEVVQTQHGQQVIDTLADKSQKPFDLAIVDLTVRNGLGAIEIVQRLRETAPAMKLVVSSGASNDPVMVGFAGAGFNDKLEKPYSLAHLVSLIERLGGVNQ